MGDSSTANHFILTIDQMTACERVRTVTCHKITHRLGSFSTLFWNNSCDITVLFCLTALINFAAAFIAANKKPCNSSGKIVGPKKCSSLHGHFWPALKVSQSSVILSLPYNCPSSSPKLEPRQGSIRLPLLEEILRHSLPQDKGGKLV